MPKHLKVCIVGVAGGRAENLYQKSIRLLPEFLEVVAVCDVNEDRLKAFATSNQISRTYVRYEDVLRDNDIDIVVISTPDHFHGVMTLAAIEAGKHVYVEVPMSSVSVEECCRIVQAAERQNRKVQMGNQVRYYDAYQTLKHHVSKGQLGEIVYAESEYWHNLAVDKFFPVEKLSSGPEVVRTWRAGFGGPAQSPICSGGMHALDSLRWVLGEEFCEVTCYGNSKGMTPSPGYSDGSDFQVALYKTPSDVIARISAGLSLSRGYSVGAAVYGTKASLEMDRVNFRGGDLDLTIYMTRVEEMAPKKDAKTRISSIAYAYDSALKGKDDPKINKPNHAMFLIFDLVKAIHEDRQPAINVYEAARSSTAAICAEISIREHRTIYSPSFHQRLK